MKSCLPCACGPGDLSGGVPAGWWSRASQNRFEICTIAAFVLFICVPALAVRKDREGNRQPFVVCC
jgi:hypothetical protein